MNPFFFFWCCRQGLQSQCVISRYSCFPKPWDFVCVWVVTSHCYVNWDDLQRCVHSMFIMIFRKQLFAAHIIMQPGVCDSKMLTGLKDLGLWSGPGHFLSQHVHAKWCLPSTRIMTYSVGGGGSTMSAFGLSRFLPNELSFFFFSTVFFIKKILNNSVLDDSPINL